MRAESPAAALLPSAMAAKMARSRSRESCMARLLSEARSHPVVHEFEDGAGNRLAADLQSGHRGSRPRCSRGSPGRARLKLSEPLATSTSIRPIAWRIAQSCSGVCRAAASWQAELSSTMRNWTSSESESDATRAIVVKDRAKVSGEGARTSGPPRPPCLEAISPWACRTRKASRIVGRLTENLHHQLAFTGEPLARHYVPGDDGVFDLFHDPLVSQDSNGRSECDVVHLESFGRATSRAGLRKAYGSPRPKLTQITCQQR